MHIVIELEIFYHRFTGTCLSDMWKWEKLPENTAKSWVRKVILEISVQELETNEDILDIGCKK